MRRRRRIAALLLAVALGVPLVWGAGFAWFVSETAATRGPPPLADGIVALTGGAERVETALRLLAEGRGRVLLISGVSRTTDFSSLAHRAGVDTALASRVTLGRVATDTRGNAAETASWVEENRLRSVLVVTSGYHMPRALAELHRAMPDTVLHPIAVIPAVTRNGATSSRLRLLAEEYTKWLIVETGLSGLAPKAEERGG